MSPDPALWSQGMGLGWDELRVLCWGKGWREIGGVLMFVSFLGIGAGLLPVVLRINSPWHLE